MISSGSTRDINDAELLNLARDEKSSTSRGRHDRVASSYHALAIRVIRHIRHLLTTELAQTLPYSLILSNAVLHGCPNYSIKKLQRL